MNKTITLEHTVNTSPENTQTHFSDFRKFSALHPLFVGLEQIDETHFIIREKMPVTGMKFNYKATVTTKDNEVLYVAYPLFLTLTLSFVFSQGETENTCKIVETVHVKGPFPGILTGLIKKMHPLLIAKLNASF